MTKNQSSTRHWRGIKPKR